MKILLVAINASYSHTNLAVRSLKYFIEESFYNEDFTKNFSSIIKIPTEKPDISFVEFTINQPYSEILRGLTSSKPDAVLFSTYIWNAELICKIIPDIKKILPNAIIGAGGPEFGYAAKIYLQKLSDLDFIICGEGEVTFLELVQNQLNHKIPGIYYRDDKNSSSEAKIIFGGVREPLCDLSKLPFAYPELFENQNEDFNTENKLFYYESNRGCPFSCSYCMSSLEKKVRFMPLERVFADLQKFLNANVKIVKFVDRTFNLDEERYIKIWEYILNHHNKKTMFHFEIEAEFLSENALNFLQKVPPNIMQFEIGVQSSNPQTLKAINRSQNISTLEQNIRRIPHTIHQHLDLIAGLPYEDLQTFGHSFDFIMNLQPDAFQLGFLKVLHGTQMEEYASKNGWKWSSSPTYETFSTPYMSYDDLNFLKDVETCVDVFYNSGHFSHLVKYILSKVSGWHFFCDVVNLGRTQKLFDALHREQFWFEFIADLILQKKFSFQNSEKLSYEIMYELLRYDFIILGKKGNFPSWYIHHYDKDKHRSLLMQNGGITNARLDFAHSEYEEFKINPLDDTEKNKILPDGKFFPMLIKYSN